MTAVQAPAPLSSSTHTSPPSALPLASPPKRERNTSDNMFHDFHSLQPVSLPHNSFPHSSPSLHHTTPLSDNHSPNSNSKPIQSQTHSQTSIQLPHPAHSSNPINSSRDTQQNPSNSLHHDPSSSSQPSNQHQTTSQHRHHTSAVTDSVDNQPHNQQPHPPATSQPQPQSSSSNPAVSIPLQSPHHTLQPIPIAQSQPLLHIPHHQQQPQPHHHHHQPIQPPAQLQNQQSLPSSFHLPQSSQLNQIQQQPNQDPRQQHSLSVQQQQSRQSQLPQLHQPQPASQQQHHQQLPTQLPQSLSLPHPSQPHLLSSSIPQVLNPQSHTLSSQPLSQQLPLPLPQQQPAANHQHQQHHQQNSVLLPALAQSHFKQADEVDVGDDLMTFTGLPSTRPQDIPGALVSSTFPTDTLPTSQEQSVMDALLPPEPEQDPLNIAVSLQMPLHLEPPRSIDRHVLLTSEPEPALRPPLSAHASLMNPHSSTAQTPNNPFSLHMPQSVAHLSYGSQPTGVPNPQVLLHGSSSVSAFQVPLPNKQPLEGPPLLMLGKDGLRTASHSNSLLQLSPHDEIQRRGSVTSNQMRIQDLTRLKTDPVVAESQFSPASPSYSAVTVSPPTLLQTTQASPASLGTPLVNVSSSGGESPTSIATPQGLSCHICKTVFTRRYNLKVHMTSKHSTRRDHRCKHCTNSFNRGDSLKRHIATTHRGERKWKCPYCKRNFGQRPHMKMHVDTVHLKKRDHKCHCGKAFGTRYNLTAHQRTHQQTPKKHLCLVCKKSFALKSSLARHQRNAAHMNPEVVETARIQN